MGRLCSRKIQITTKPDPTTLRPAGLRSSAGFEGHVKYPIFLEPQQPVTGTRAPHATVTSPSAFYEAGGSCNVEDPGLLNPSSAHIDCKEEYGTKSSGGRAREGKDPIIHTTVSPCPLLAAPKLSDESGTLHDTHYTLHSPTRKSVSEISLCLEPEAHQQPPVPPTRPSRGPGSEAFRVRQLGQQDLLQHLSGVLRSSSSAGFVGSDKREGIRTQYYPYDTHSRIFATEPFTGRIRVRGDVAMKLYMRNFSTCPEEESEPFKQRKRHVRPNDNFNVLQSDITTLSDTREGHFCERAPVSSRTCPTNVNRFQTDFMTWRTPQSAAEPRDRFSIKLVAHPLEAGDLLSWDTSWKHGEKATGHTLACNTPVKDEQHTDYQNSLPNPWANLKSSKLPSRIASARKLADYIGNGIFSTSLEASTPPPDFTSLGKVLAAENQALVTALPLDDCGKPCSHTVKNSVSTLDFRERRLR